MDARRSKFPEFIKPKNPAELSAELSRLARIYVSGIEWQGYEPPSGVYRSSIDDLDEFIATTQNDVMQYIVSLDNTLEEKYQILENAMQHDLFHYRYVAAAKSFVAEPFPYQNVPLVFFGEYNDSPRYPGLFDNHTAACTATYQKLYAHGAKLLKEFADAIQSPDTLDQYISDCKESINPHLLTEIEQHFSADLNATPELLYSMALQNADKKNLQGIDEKLHSALFVTQTKFHFDCMDEFKNTTQYDSSYNGHIMRLLDNNAPLLGLRYDAAINCFAFVPPYRTPALAFHSAAEMIQELTSVARMLRPIAPDRPEPSLVSGTLFARANGHTNSATEAAPSLTPMKRCQ